MTILSESGFGGTKPWSGSKLEGRLDSRGVDMHLKKIALLSLRICICISPSLSVLCIIITQERQLAVIFEDDAEVSPHWYGAEIGNLQQKKETPVYICKVQMAGQHVDGVWWKERSGCNLFTEANNEG